MERQAALNFTMKQNLVNLQKENIIGEMNSKFKTLELRENMLNESIRSLNETIGIETDALNEVLKSIKEVDVILFAINDNINHLLSTSV